MCWLLQTLLLIGLSCSSLVGAQFGNGRPRCDYESYFVVEVNIQPSAESNVQCDKKGATKLKKLIQGIVDMKFIKYFEKTAELAAVEMENFCGGGG